MKICHLLNMPVAKDLFRYAIVESGSGKVGADNREEATDNARNFLANLGITEKELNRLKNFSSQEILRAAEPFLHSFRPVPDDIYLKTQKVPMFAYEDLSLIHILVIHFCQQKNRYIVSGTPPEICRFRLHPVS